jgi:undecaprenyl-diphosphatase
VRPWIPRYARPVLAFVALLVILLAAVPAPWRAAATPAATPATPVAVGGDPTPEELAEAGDQLTAGNAIVLGVVEGVTEFLPISSTGHLLVTQRILDIGTTDGTKDVADTYAIAIQFGAILAVLFLYAHRVRTLVEGVVGRSDSGRRILVGLVLAFAPAVAIGLLFEPVIKERLLGTWQVIAAWAFWGVVTLFVSDRWGRDGGTPLERITMRQGVLIGFAQVLAMWPGTSRSLVTILAALVLGLSLAAAVEFSFLLGLVTLGGATIYETLSNGATMFEAYGWVNPVLGLLAAFVSALVAVKWMVGYLQRHSFAIFGWYRLVVAGLAATLVLTDTI